MSNLRVLFLTSAALLVACSANSADDGVEGADQDLVDCDSAGNWALKVETPVKWNSSAILDGGQGTITNWLLSKRTQNALTITDTAQLCGVDVPDYKSKAMLGGEKFGLSFSDAAFAGSAGLTLNGTLSAKGVGATYKSPAAAALLGATMADADSDAWPTNLTGVKQLDSDRDSKPGISVDAKSGAGYAFPPVNITKSVRANRVYTAFRQVLASTSGTVKSCNRVEGKGTIATIANKPAIDNHVLGCRHTDGSDCSESEYKLLDSAAPVYTPTGEATITMVKLPASVQATCPNVRKLDFSTIQ